MKRIAIITPLIDTEPDDNVVGFCESIEKQTFDVSRILWIPVVRYSGDEPSIIWDMPAGSELSQVNFDGTRFNHPTQMEQCEKGIERALEFNDVAHLVIACAGDQLHHDFVKDLRFALTADPRVKVSIPDVVYCDEDMKNPETVKMFDGRTLHRMVNSNVVPDMSMVTREACEKVPFSSQYGRSSLWIWWINLFRHFGPEAFVNVHRGLYLYRYHPDTASSFNDEWRNKGYEVFSEWARSEGLIPPGARIRPFPKEEWHPKAKKRLDKTTV